MIFIMSNIKLFDHQVEALNLTKDFNKVAYYYDQKWDLVKHS